LNVQVLGLPGKEMDIADAVMLFYMGNCSKRQWEADKVNSALDWAICWLRIIVFVLFCCVEVPRGSRCK
jgi:hypothetical protein